MITEGLPEGWGIKITQEGPYQGYYEIWKDGKMQGSGYLGESDCRTVIWRRHRASLIQGAAFDMYEACLEALQVIEQATEYQGEILEVAAKLREAVAKAEGRL